MANAQRPIPSFSKFRHAILKTWERIWGQGSSKQMHDMVIGNGRQVVLITYTWKGSSNATVIGNGRHAAIRIYMQYGNDRHINWSACGLTWIWILQSLLETRERRAEGIRELDKDLVHGEDTLLP